jgi:hypothetical protein
MIFDLIFGAIAISALAYAAISVSRTARTLGDKKQDADPDRHVLRHQEKPTESLVRQEKSTHQSEFLGSIFKIGLTETQSVEYKEYNSINSDQKAQDFQPKDLIFKYYYERPLDIRPNTPRIGVVGSSFYVTKTASLSKRTVN